MSSEFYSLIKIKLHVVARGPYRERTCQNVFFFFQKVTNNTARQTWEIIALTL